MDPKPNNKFDKNKITKRSENTLLSQEGDKIICIHCKRTMNNNIGCMGICVADSDY